MTWTRRRVCVVYDCLYPWTVGGAERWLTAVARSAASAGHDVTYLTRTQWPEHDPPRLPGVQVVAVSPNDPLYRADGSRTLREPLRFGRGVYGHLRRHRAAYDVVHTHAFPFFGALGVARALSGTSVPIVVDWAEVWPAAYWREYGGSLAGRAGWWLQARTARIAQHALVPSRLHADRLRELGVNGSVTVLTGQYDGDIESEPRPATSPPTVVFAGRHIAEKRVVVLPDAIAIARRRIPSLEATILGDGPDRPTVIDRIKQLGLESAIRAPGFVSADDVDEAIGSATCLVLPSQREGYGLVVVEAATRGTPAVVCSAADNASTELIDVGRNGFISPSASPEDLAAAIVRCVEGGPALRRSTLAWATDRGEALTVRGSVRQVLGVYDDALGGSEPSMRDR